MSPLICLRCVLVDYPPPGLGARPRGHSRDDKIPPRLLLATLATRPPPLCPLSSPLSANGNCYSQSITINRGPQGLETRACNEPLRKFHNHREGPILVAHLRHYQDIRREIGMSTQRSCGMSAQVGALSVIVDTSSKVHCKL